MPDVRLHSRDIGKQHHVGEHRRQAEQVTIYVMARCVDYGEPWYGAALCWLSTVYPSATIIPARDRWQNTAHWLREWPVFGPQVNLGIVLTDTGGMIGRGVLTETLDLLALDRPVRWLTVGGTSFRLINLPAVQIVNRHDWNNYGRLGYDDAHVRHDERGHRDMSCTPR